MQCRMQQANNWWANITKHLVLQLFPVSSAVLGWFVCFCHRVLVVVMIFSYLFAVLLRCLHAWREEAAASFLTDCVKWAHDVWNWLKAFGFILCEQICIAAQRISSVYPDYTWDLHPWCLDCDVNHTHHWWLWFDVFFCFFPHNFPVRGRVVMEHLRSSLRFTCSAHSVWLWLFVFMIASPVSLLSILSRSRLSARSWTCESLLSPACSSEPSETQWLTDLTVWEKADI